MNLTDLKTKPIPELLEIAHEMGMDNLGRSRKQEIKCTVVDLMGMDNWVRIVGSGYRKRSIYLF